MQQTDQTLVRGLASAGLSKLEAKLYLAVLNLGQASILDISRHSGLNRTTIYRLIDRLSEQHLLDVTVRGKRKLYVARSAEEVINILKKRITALDVILPLLRSVGLKSPVKPKIRYWEGIDGIKTAYKNSLQAK